MNQQILFSSEDQSSNTFENFFAADNANVLSALNSFLSNQNEFGCFYLYGESGSGKTHLLKSAVNALNIKGNASGVYLDIGVHIEQLRQLSHENSIALLALDNIERLLNYDADMMLVFETLRQNNAKLVLSSTLAPKALSSVVKDLSSRFLSGQVFELKMLDDGQKIEALELRASLRGFKLSDEVIHYVINRYPRDFHTLFGLLDKLDDASLQNQRKITVPFIKTLEC